MKCFLSLVLVLGLLASPKLISAEDKKQSSSFLNLFFSNKDSDKKKKALSKKKRAKKKVRRKKPNSLSKERLLAQSRRQPKKTSEQLAEELDSQLADLKAVCGLKSHKESALREKLKAFQKFLRDSLGSDPYMVFEYKLAFGDLLDLTAIEDESPMLSASDFDSSYKRFLSLPDSLGPDSYPDSWARALWETFKCAENPDEK